MCHHHEGLFRILELDCARRPIISQPKMAQKSSAKNDLMPLLALFQFHPGERLEQEAVQVRHPDPCGVDVCVVTPSNPADLTFVGHGET